jgi:hypothetical protein
MMSETQEALTKRDEKRRREKEAAAASIDLTKQTIRGPKDGSHDQFACGGEPDHVRRLEHHGFGAKGMVP